MKKIFLLLPLLFLLTGCGNKITCTTTISENSSSYKLKIVANLKDDKVTSGKMILIFDNKDNANQICELYKTINDALSESEKIDYTCNGNKLTLNALSLEADDTEEKLIGASRDDFIQAFKENFEDGTCN